MADFLELLKDTNFVIHYFNVTLTSNVEHAVFAHTNNFDLRFIHLLLYSSQSVRFMAKCYKYIMKPSSNTERFYPFETQVPESSKFRQTNL